jgi:hypothetical protein
VKWTHATAALLFATSLAAQTDVRQHVYTDALVVDRLAEVSTKRELPTDLLKRIVTEDIELMRGRRTDGSYEFASWERFEASRVKDGFSVQPRSDKMETLEIKGEYVYRVILDAAERRLVVRKNRPIWIERVDFEYVPLGTTTSAVLSNEVKAWMQPGEIRTIELPVIARQAKVKVIATADEKGGYGNITVALVQARIVDNADSPYADAVTSAKSMLRALENEDVPVVRSMAQRVRDGIGAAPLALPASRVASTPQPAAAASSRDTAALVETQAELQLIEDLLTGNENERRQGMDRLHQLIRKSR